MDKKKKIILFTTIGVLVTGLCVATGIFLARHVFVDYNNKETEKGIEDYEINYSDIYASYLAKKDSKTTEQLYQESKGYEFVNYALSKKVNREYVSSYTEGATKAAIATQEIGGKFIYDNGHIIQESISTGLISTAKRFEKDGDTIHVYDGTPKSSKEADWNKNPTESLSLTAFKDKWGIDYSFPTIFIISNETVLKEDRQVDENNYVVTLELDPTISTLKYVKQQREMGEMSKDPVFKKVELIFTIDSNLNILKLTTIEESAVKRGLWVDSSSSYDEIFTYTK